MLEHDAIRGPVQMFAATSLKGKVSRRGFAIAANSILTVLGNPRPLSTSERVATLLAAVVVQLDEEVSERPKAHPDSALCQPCSFGTADD